jgi:quinoprotein glucose dehydrogenase
MRMNRAALAFTLSIAALLGAQQGAPRGEWRTYGGDLGNTRYSPLDQINAQNFNQLQVAWRFKTDNLGRTPELNLQATPLMVRGVLYSTAGTRRNVVALDAATGELLWTHREDEGRRADLAPRQYSGRGVAYWEDGNDQRILYVTPGYRLLALDAKTGIPVRSFGTNGVVDLKLGNDQEIDPLSGEIGYQSAPVVARDVVIIGAAHKTGANPPSMKNVKGYVRGFDVRTGRRLWIFHTIPTGNEFGNDSWENNSNSYTGNAGVWAQISVDEELGLVYLPVEMPTGDYYGGHRPGNGLFGETLVAVDLRTGVRKWHYQLVHHGIWDHDISCAPILVDIVVNGRAIKAVAQPTKQSILYVFDRATGDPVWPIVERPVEKGDVPGEWYSPTQPIPTKPLAYDRNGVSVEDLIDFTPQLRAEALQRVSQYKLGPIFTPPVVSKLGGPLATLTLGTSGGGTNWPGGSFDPETQILYVFSQTQVLPLSLVPGPNLEAMRYVQGSALTGARTTGGSGTAASAGASNSVASSATLDIQGLPLIKPPYGRISAIDLSKGEIVWQVAHGETPDNVRNHPALRGLTIPRTGRAGLIGTLVTKSLVIAGESGFFTTPSGARGAMLRAYDKATGKDAGAVFMPAPQTGSPMTYQLNGQQYIVVAISSAAHTSVQTYTGELVAFRLP